MKDLATTQPQDPMAVILQAVQAGQKLDLDSVRGLNELRREFEQERARDLFAGAMSRASARMPTLRRDAKGQSGAFSSYEHMDAQCRPIYTAEGLSVSFDTADSPIQGHQRYVAILTHEGGHIERRHIDLPADTSGNKNAVQAAGSSLTYAKRYLLMQVFALAQEQDPSDDDAKATGKSDEAARVFELMRHNQVVREQWELVFGIKSAMEAEDWPTTASLLNQMDNDMKHALWLAPTKGGIFTTQERKAMKSDQVAKLRREVR